MHLPVSPASMDGEDAASLPVYPLAFTLHPLDVISRNSQEILCRIEILRIESLIKVIERPLATREVIPSRRLAVSRI